MVKPVKDFYDANVEYEWNRLFESPYHKLEFDTTLYFLKNYLPKKGLILDAGGGPGRYSVELAKMNYDVVLLDLSSENVKFAKKEVGKLGLGNNVREIVEGSILDLSRFESNSFDSVLCLGGPLSHVKGGKNRKKAVKELIRVCRNKGTIFISVISKFGTMIQSPNWPDEIADTKHWNNFVKKGDDNMFHKDYYAHFFTPEELEELFKNESVKIVDLVALEGLSNPLHELVNNMKKNNPKAWKNWIKTHYELIRNPVIVNTSAHFMIIVNKI